MRVQRGNSQFARLCTATISRACWTLPVTSCSCTCTSSLMDGTIRQGITPSCQIPNTRAGSHDVTRALKKNKPRDPRDSPREHMCPAPVTCTVHSADRTHRAGHVGVPHTCSRTEPIHSEFSTQPDLCPSAGSAISPRAFPDRVLTLATVLAGVSSEAQHGLPVLYRADPARSRMQLQPLPGIFLP